MFKTQPMKHQLEALARLQGRPGYALFMEQGTGKSKVIIDEAAALFRAGELDALIIAAPNGVHRNWINNELPAHMPDDIPMDSWAWSATAGKRALAALESIRHRAGRLLVVALNLEALRTASGHSLVADLLAERSAMLVVDESTRIKNPKAQITKALFVLADRAKFRRVLNGTPITQAPVDLWAQLRFLGKEAVPIKSHLAFQHRYCQFLPPTHPLVRHAAARSRWAPSIQARDKEGQPIYQNLDELKEWADQWGFRVLKADCLDLPEKIYKRYPVTLSGSHLKNVLEGLARMRSGHVAVPMNPLQKMSAYQRLLHGIFPKQITGEAAHVRMFEHALDNSRVQALLQALEDHPGQAIIWCKFTSDIADVIEALGQSNCAAYWGEINATARDEAVQQFQAGKKRFFVGNAAAGGVGLTLTAAETVVYYSNTFRLYDRLQSEDRAHRIGQRRHVVYIDLEAEGTLDTKIINALRAKKDVANMITGDPDTGWLNYEGET